MMLVAPQIQAEAQKQSQKSYKDRCVEIVKSNRKKIVAGAILAGAILCGYRFKGDIAKCLAFLGFGFFSPGKTPSTLSTPEWFTWRVGACAAVVTVPFIADYKVRKAYDKTSEKVQEEVEKREKELIFSGQKAI